MTAPHRHAWAALSCIVAAAVATPAWGGESPAGDPSGAVAPPTTDEVEARRAFIEERLAAGTFGSNLWWYTWLGLTGAYWALQVGIASTTDDPDRRTRSVASAIKSTLTVTTIALLPNPARTAQENVEAMDDATPQARAARLAEGERLLRYAAVRAKKKTSWLAHTLSATINALTAAILIYGFDQEVKPVALSAALGFAAMEISYLTYPQRPRVDVADYDARFGPSAPRGVAAWSMVPTAGGTALVVSF